MSVLHQMYGRGVACNHKLEMLNATGDTSQVTCGRCIRIRAQAIRRNIDMYERWLSFGLPPLTKMQHHIHAGRPRTVDQVTARLEELRTALRDITEGR